MDNNELGLQLIETLKALTATLKALHDALMLMTHPVYVVPQPAYPAYPFLGTLVDAPNADGTRTFTMQQSPTITDPLGLVSPEGLSDKAMAAIESAAQDH